MIEQDLKDDPYAQETFSNLLKIAIQEAEERQRKWDIECEKRRLEDEEKKRAEYLKDSQDELFSIIETC